MIKKMSGTEAQDSTWREAARITEQPLPGSSAPAFEDDEGGKAAEGDAEIDLEHGGDDEFSWKDSLTETRKIEGLEAVSASIRKFENERELEKARKFRLILNVGLVGMFGGLITYALLAVIFSYRPNLPLFTLLGFLAILTTVTGIIVISTVPNEDYDFDDVMRSYKIVRAGISCCCFLMSILIAMVPPYCGGFTLAALGAVMFLTTFWTQCPVEFSLQFCVWLNIFFFCNFTWIFNCAINAGKNLDAGALAGKPFGINAQARFRPMWASCSAVSLGWQLIFAYVWISRQRATNKEPIWTWRKVSTTGVFEAIYLWLAGTGIDLVVQGIGTAIIVPKPVYLVIAFGLGLNFLLPLLLVLAVGRDRVFNFTSRLFERGRAEQDGAFIAELLDVEAVEVGQQWYIHRGDDEKDEQFTDFRRNWRCGKITEKEEGTFSVEVLIDDKKGVAPYKKISSVKAGANLTSDELLRLAHANLRCIRSSKIEIGLFDGSLRESSTERMYDRSMPVPAGEKIDFFISHSWHDQGAEKFAALQNLAAEFKRVHRREPTFWFDKVCIDQNRITDGLKVLPINIMACSKMLVLCGQTYPNRLWCVCVCGVGVCTS